MKATSLVTGLALAALAMPAAAAPWRNLSQVSGDYHLHYAVQNDHTGEYTFALSCIEETDQYSMLLNTPNGLDPAHRPAVPLTVTVNETAYPPLSFQFLDAGGQEAIGFGSADWPEEYAAMQAVLSDANGDITLSYLDRSVTFAAEGIDAAVLTMASECSQ